MKIGIIGAGAMARAIGKHAINVGYNVMLSNTRGKSGAEAIAKALGCMAGSAQEAASYGDLVVLAVPLRAYRSLPASELSGKVVVDILNYFPHRDGTIAALQKGELTTSELLAQQLPRARVVKALNSITAEDLLKDVRPEDATERRAMPIASDDPDAKSMVFEFVNKIGFDPVDAGGLADSWRFERFRPVYCVALDQQMMKAKLAATTRDTTVPDGYWLYNRQVLL
ncbi:NAD(P)-binding domain-containing protein [Salmonella enterica subsp. enterica serovar Eastbourne]|nr:NAD(P)-binding domain-containing protein [Salmonella enterica subsp. enterica serovar Eastbourne]EHC5910054.1 NAD(P)-binding domain-containing protein [Salmonella enterica subsp. enterica serovar Eastbourne]